MKIPLNKFLGFVQTTSGAGRIAQVEDSLLPYDPQTDFYKKFRPALVAGLRTGDFEELSCLPERMQDERKQNNFAVCVKNLKIWARKNEYEFMSEALPQIWAHEGLEINVNPEILLKINGRPFWVKLYMSKPRLGVNARKSALYLMAETFDLAKGFPAILDVRRGDLISPAPPNARYGAFVESEAMAFLTILKNRRRSA